MAMKVRKNTPPRKFNVGQKKNIEISDCGTIELRSDEQVTFVTASGKQYDLTAKSWGFYATPSVNGRLLNQGFKTALVKNSFGKYYILVVDTDHMHDFKAYLLDERSKVIKWLDDINT